MSEKSKADSNPDIDIQCAIAESKVQNVPSITISMFNEVAHMRSLVRSGVMSKTPCWRCKRARREDVVEQIESCRGL